MIRFTLAISQELNDWLEKQAKIQKRSKNKHVEFLLQELKEKQEMKSSKNE